MAEKQKSSSPLKPGTVRREALLALEQARAEISAQAAELRHDLNPANAARAAMVKHPAWTTVAAAGAGLLVSWLLFRRKTVVIQAPPPREIRQAITDATRKSVGKNLSGSVLSASLLGPVAAMALKTVTPYLMKTAFPYLMKTGLAYHQQRKNAATQTHPVL